MPELAPLVLLAAILVALVDEVLGFLVFLVGMIWILSIGG